MRPPKNPLLDWVEAREIFRKRTRILFFRFLVTVRVWLIPAFLRNSATRFIAKQIQQIRLTPR